MKKVPEGPSTRLESFDEVREATLFRCELRGVPRRRLRSYVAFARRVDWLCRRYSSNTLLLEVAAVMRQFAARGLNPRVLADIRFHVFTLGRARAY